MRVSPSPFTILLFFSRKKKKKIFDLITFSRRRHHFSLLEIFPLSLSLSLFTNIKQNKTAKRDDILKYTLVADNMLVRAIYLYMCVCVCFVCTLRNNDVSKSIPSRCSYSKKFLIEKKVMTSSVIYGYTCRGKMQKISPFDV